MTKFLYIIGIQKLTTKKIMTNNIENPNYDLCIDKIQSVEDKDNTSSKPHNQILCSICKRSDKIVTDPDSGEVICSNCGMVLVDKVEDTSQGIIEMLVDRK